MSGRGYTQVGRPIRLDTKLGKDVLLLEEFTGGEGVSQQFSFHLRAVSTNGAIDLEGLLQTPVVMTLVQAGGGERYFHGIVSRAVRLERAKGLTTYTLEVVPWTWFLSLSTDCRIFKKTSVPDIIKEVFKVEGQTDFQVKLQGTYAPREYCVQYRETNLDFISRLMEDEGIFYFFEHTAAKHTLVITDQQQMFVDCPFHPNVEYGPSWESTVDNDLIKSLSMEHSVRSRTVTLTDYDFQKPKVDLAVRATTNRYDLYDYPGGYYTRDEGDHYAKVHLEEQEVQRVALAGMSNCRQFGSGYKFNLHDISGQMPDDAYILISVGHSASAASYRSDGSEPFSYDNHFHAIPAAITYRPPRITRKPTVRGTQTAVVVGPAGEEFHVVDKYGRVEVHFFWDRLNKNSCPVRVSQNWAGKNWGAIQLPRIGQEVVVDFLEGDPDRPLIVGRVYSAEQMPPYDLPADQTISGIKSRSSKGGGAANFNELIMDDKKGSEVIRIHAEKDINEFVEHDTYEYIGNDRHLMVDGSQSEAVKGDKHLSVKGEHRQEVGDVSLKVKAANHMKVGTVYAVDSGQEIHLKGGMKVIIEAGMQISLVGAGGFIDIGPAGVTIQGIMVKINSGGAKGSGTAASPKAPKAPVKAK